MAFMAALAVGAAVFLLPELLTRASTGNPFAFFVLGIIVWVLWAHTRGGIEALRTTITPDRLIRQTAQGESFVRWTDATRVHLHAQRIVLERG